jgi:hypothetical protein
MSGLGWPTIVTMKRRPLDREMRMSVSQLTLVASAGDGGNAAGALEDFVLELRAELADAGVSRIDPVQVGSPPKDTRGIETVVVIGLLLTLVQTSESVVNIARAIRAVMTRRNAKKEPAVELSINGTKFDLADADAAYRQLLDAVRQSPTWEAAVEGRYALIVLNSVYADSRLTELRSPAHDGDALARVLGDAAIGGFAVDVAEDLDERTLRRRLSAFFANRHRDDLLLVHFSCHGVKDPFGHLYLTASDTNLSDLAGTAIGASYVHQLLAQTESKRVVLMLDCCYSGAYRRDAVLAKDQVPIPDQFGTGTGRVVLTASAATEYAFEAGVLMRSDARPSVFTSALVEGLESGDADFNRDGEITVDEIFEYLRRRLRGTSVPQTPMRWIFGEDGSLILARSPWRATLSADILEDMASSKVPVRLEVVLALSRMLNGDPARRAVALAALVGMSETDDSNRVRLAARHALDDNHAAGSTPNGRLDDEPAGAVEQRREALAPVALLLASITGAAVAGVMTFFERDMLVSAIGAGVAACLACVCYVAVSRFTRR